MPEKDSRSKTQNVGLLRVLAGPVVGDGISEFLIRPGELVVLSSARGHGRKQSIASIGANCRDDGGEIMGPSPLSLYRNLPQSLAHARSSVCPYLDARQAVRGYVISDLWGWPSLVSPIALIAPMQPFCGRGVGERLLWLAAGSPKL